MSNDYDTTNGVVFVVEMDGYYTEKQAKAAKAPDKILCKACAQGTPDKKPRRYIKRLKTWKSTSTKLNT